MSWFSGKVLAVQGHEEWIFGGQCPFYDPGNFRMGVLALQLVPGENSYVITRVLSLSIDPVLASLVLEEGLLVDNLLLRYVSSSF